MKVRANIKRSMYNKVRLLAKKYKKTTTTISTRGITAKARDISQSSQIATTSHLVQQNDCYKQNSK